MSSAVPLSLAKLSPATNTSTGRGDVSPKSPDATSSTFRSLSPYLMLRENETPSHVFDGSAAASAGGAIVSSPASAAPSREASISGDPDAVARADAAVIAVSRQQRTRHFVIASHA